MGWLFTERGKAKVASYQAEREAFLVALSKEGVPVEVGRQVLTAANTLQRLAVAQCNGDWPADNGDRETAECVTCGSYWHPSDLKGPAAKCGDCRTAERLRLVLAPYGVTPILGGDPRGCVVKLTVPSGTTDDWGNTGLCVPTRRYRDGPDEN